MKFLLYQIVLSFPLQMARGGWVDPDTDPALRRITAQTVGDDREFELVSFRILPSGFKVYLSECISSCFGL